MPTIPSPCRRVFSTESRVCRASPHAPQHTAHVMRVLGDIGATETKQVLVMNKIDRLPDGEPYWMIHAGTDEVCLGCGEPDFLTWPRTGFAGDIPVSGIA